MSYRQSEAQFSPGHQPFDHHREQYSVSTDHPDLQARRRFNLLTRNAHALYSKFGFAAAKHPSRSMEIHTADFYTRSKKET